MARIRSIKPEIWTDSRFMGCSTDARLLFIGLRNFMDDKGRIPLDAKSIKAQVFPGDDILSANVLRMIDELSRLGLLRIYIVENKQYLLDLTWADQRIDRPQPAKYPAPEKHEQLTFLDHSASTRRPFDERSTTDRIGEDRISKKETLGEALLSGAAREGDLEIASPPDASMQSDPEAASAWTAPAAPRPTPEALAHTTSAEYVRQERALMATIPAASSWPIAATPTTAPMPMLAQDFDFDTEVLPTFGMLVRRWTRQGVKPKGWAWVAGAVRGEIEAKGAAAARVSANTPTSAGAPAGANGSAPDWNGWVQTFKATNGGSWLGEGPSPAQEGCRAPPEVLERHGYAPVEAMEDAVARWERLVAEFRDTETWEAYRAIMGPAPGEPGCRCPPDILVAHGFDVIEVDGLGVPLPRRPVLVQTAADGEDDDDREA